MASVSQKSTNGKLAVTTVLVTDPAQFDSLLNLPDVSDDLHARVARGDVATGSEWDGWALDDIYHALRHEGHGDAAAASFTDAIMENRYHFARHPLGVA